MSEKPILFSTPMIKVILEGRKTQTRRVVTNIEQWMIEDTCKEYHLFQDKYGDNQKVEDYCPYGTIGSKLWVRERFLVQPDLWACNHNPQPIHYYVDGDIQCLEDYVGKPSIHMPHWASRITLEITDIRVQKIQNIPEDDAQSEGVERLELSPRYLPDLPEPFNKFPFNQVHPMTSTYKEAFEKLWDSINSKRGYSWQDNVWVWAITFKKLDNEVK